MAKKKNSESSTAETILKKAQKQADELIATAKDAADSAKKSAKKAKKSARKASGSQASPIPTSPEPAARAEDAPQATERSSAADALPLPTVDDPAVPSDAWTAARLRTVARERGVTGYGSMRKDQLVALLTDRG